jgi:hypothetical protein
MSVDASGRSPALGTALTGQRLVVATWVVFGVAALASLVFLGYAGKGQTFKGDEWGYAHRLATESLGSVLFNTGEGKYLLVLPMILYKLAFSTIGVAHYLPYRVAAILLNVAIAGLLLILASRRVGYVIALSGAVLIMFLGSSSEITSTALRIPEQIALLAGLAMLLSLERQTVGRDLAACVLLSVSITSHPMGLAFAAAAAVLTLSRPTERWRRAWIFLIPLVLFGAWYVFLREPATDSVTLGHQLRDVPKFEFQELAVIVASITGVFRSPFNGHIEYLTTVAYFLAIATVIGVGVRAMTTRPSALFWALLAGLLILFAAPAFAPGGLRDPTASRYVLPGVVLLLLLVCEAFAGLRIASARVRLTFVAVAIAIFAFSLYSNAKVLHQAAALWGSRGTQVRAELTALDLAGTKVSRLFQPENPAAQPPIPSTHSGLSDGQYFDIKSAYGSPAFSPAELASKPVTVRNVADIVLARALDVRLQPTGTLAPAPHATPPRLIASTTRVRDRPAGCIRIVAGDKAASTQLRLPPGGVTLSAAGSRAPVNLALGRFSPSYGYPTRPLLPGESAALAIPGDFSPVPWRLLVRTPGGSVTVCARD